MTTTRFSTVVNRRSVLAGVGDAGICLAIDPLSGRAGAQKAPASAMSNHPMVGTWIVDRIPGNPTEMPTAHVYHADGTLTDPVDYAAGAWVVTGPQR